MKRQREEGVCFAYSKADGSCYTIDRAEYPRLLADWMAGKAFWTGLAFYGSTITLKLGDICAVSDCLTEHMTARRQDEDADKAEDAING